jgi:hypothetical protein
VTVNVNARQGTARVGYPRAEIGLGHVERALMEKPVGNAA